MKTARFWTIQVRPVDNAHTNVINVRVPFRDKRAQDINSEIGDVWPHINFLQIASVQMYSAGVSSRDGQDQLNIEERTITIIDISVYV